MTELLLNIAVKITEDIKNELLRKELYINEEQINIISYYIDFHLSNLIN